MIEAYKDECTFMPCTKKATGERYWYLVYQNENGQSEILTELFYYKERRVCIVDDYNFTHQDIDLDIQPILPEEFETEYELSQCVVINCLPGGDNSG